MLWFYLLLCLFVLLKYRRKIQQPTLQNCIKTRLPYKQNNNQQYLPQYSTKNERAQDSVIEVRLVELALKQPKFDEAEAQQKNIDLQLEKQRKAWLKSY